MVDFVKIILGIKVIKPKNHKLERKIFLISWVYD